jgi:NADH:ubiquinone oxidoreductase subunit E
MKKLAWISAAVVVACLVLLTADWGIAAYRQPKDEQIVKHYQKQVKEDSSVAPKLDAEQKRITAARIARRQRDRATAWILILASAVFLASVKRLLTRRRFVNLATLKARPAPLNRKKSRKTSGSDGASDSADFIEQLVTRYGRSKEATIPLLQAIQSHYRYLPDEAIHRVCQLTEITPAEISGVSTFYGQFRSTPVGKHVVRVCHGTACHVAGSRQITEELRRYLKLPDGEDTDAARTFTLEGVACLGCCSLAPVLMVDEHTAGRLTPATASSALEDVEQKEPV